MWVVGEEDVSKGIPGIVYTKRTQLAIQYPFWIKKDWSLAPPQGGGLDFLLSRNSTKWDASITTLWNK